MNRLLALLAAGALGCGTEPLYPDSCVYACEQLSPGKIAVKCDRFDPEGRDTSPPNDFGGCYCTDDGLCPPGQQPHR